MVLLLDILDSYVKILLSSLIVNYLAILAQKYNF